MFQLILQFLGFSKPKTIKLVLKRIIWGDPYDSNEPKTAWFAKGHEPGV